jgi:hypothetical protein
MRARSLALASLLALASSAAMARAEEPPRTTIPFGDGVRGLARPALRPEVGRTALDALLFIPRETINLIFFATGTAATLIRDEQVVPRVEELLSPPPGEVTIFPMIFLDTRQKPSVGARMLASGGAAGTSLTAGFGGVHDMNLEGRLHLASPRPFPVLFALEAFFDQRSSLEFLGVGQDPDRDARNHFNPLAPSHDATYLEQRTRLLASVGVRPSKDLELFLSSSFNESRVRDTPDAGDRAVSFVFQPGSLQGAPSDPNAAARAIYGYTEAAMRLDTRPTRGTPSAGFLFETYVGTGRGYGNDATEFVRVGGRAGAFASIARPTNVLGLRLAIDGIGPTRNAPLPFTALSSQPDYRGFDTRRDRVSAVLSADYRWMVTRHVGMRLFADAATVTSNLSLVFQDTPRVDGGFGVDLFSSSTEIAAVNASLSQDGVHVYFTFGLPSAFGDRQHRY